MAKSARRNFFASRVLVQVQQRNVDKLAKAAMSKEMLAAGSPPRPPRSAPAQRPARNSRRRPRRRRHCFAGREQHRVQCDQTWLAYRRSRRRRSATRDVQQMVDGAIGFRGVRLLGRAAKIDASEASAQVGRKSPAKRSTSTRAKPARAKSAGTSGDAEQAPRETIDGKALDDEAANDQAISGAAKRIVRPQRRQSAARTFTRKTTRSRQERARPSGGTSEEAARA